MSSDERDSQLSAMFDGELPDSECELLARRLSRDPALKQQWARYSLIGAVIRDEPVHARRASGGRLDAGIAARLANAIEAEDAAMVGGSASGAVAIGDDAAAFVPAARFAGGAGGAGRWVRPATGVAIAASVAALSVFWLQGRSPAVGPVVAQPADLVARQAAAGDVEVIAPPAATRGVAAEVVVAGNGYPAPAAARGAGSGEPESYVVPLPSESRGVAAPAQLANYVVAHSEYSAPLSRRSLLSALVAAEAPAGAVAVAPAAAVDAGAVDPEVRIERGSPPRVPGEAAK